MVFQFLLAALQHATGNRQVLSIGPPGDSRTQALTSWLLVSIFELRPLLRIFAWDFQDIMVFIRLVVTSIFTLLVAGFTGMFSDLLEHQLPVLDLGAVGTDSSCSDDDLSDIYGLPIIQATRVNSESGSGITKPFQVGLEVRDAGQGLITPIAPTFANTPTSTGADPLIQPTLIDYLPSYTNTQTNWAAIGFSANPTSYAALPTPSASGTVSFAEIENGVPLRYVINSSSIARYELNGLDENLQDYVYVTLNICQEPASAAKNQQSLTLYASASNSSSRWPAMEAILGFANITLLEVTTGKAFIELEAPSTQNKDDQWTFEIAASTKMPMHRANIGPSMNLVDTDFAHALFVTNNFTMYSNRSVAQNISDFDLFVYGDQDKDNLIEITSQGTYVTKDNRLAWSYCGISTGPALLNGNNAEESVTRRGYGNELKGQYFLNGLNMSTSYIAYLTKPNNKSESMGTGGGEVFLGVNFTTKSDTNCQLIYNLDFCSSVAYAAPGNASVYTAANLSSFYDNIASSRFDNFTKSLQQIDCDASPAQAFSPFRTCDNCAEAYKQWLCAITIPRCTDWNRNESYLYSRPVNTSRNPIINDVLRPGSYKEILPCMDLCNQLVQNCPAALGFSCPKLNDIFGLTYGTYSDDGDVSCSFPGALYYQSFAAMVRPQLSMLLLGMCIFLGTYFA